MRVFVAVELPEQLRRRLAALVESLRADLPRARWVRAENLHLTLAFLGEVDESVVGGLQEGLARQAVGLQPVSIGFAGGGFFPSPRRPRVAWLGGSAPGLELWAESAAEAAVRAGATVDRRPYSLHLTLARLNVPWRQPEVERFLARVAEWKAEPFTVGEMVLFSSELRPGGPRYTVVGRWPVGGGSR